MKNPFNTALQSAGNRKKRYLYFLVFACVLTVLYITHPSVFDTSERAVLGQTDMMNNHQTLVQPFVLTKPSHSLSFSIATYRKLITKGKMTVEIIDADTGEQKVKEVYKDDELEDNHTFTIYTELPPGNYLMSFGFNGFQLNKNIVIYTVYPPHTFCTVDDEMRDYEVNIDIKYKSNISELNLSYLLYAGMILLAMAVSLTLSARKLIRVSPESRRNIVLRYALAYACLLIVVVTLYTCYRELLATGVINYLHDNQERFYFLVALMAIFLFLVADRSPWTCWLLMALIGLVWILTDLPYNVIDEGGHTEILRFILDTKGKFPYVSQNYEGVQGPVYYYVAALLTGWLPESQIYLGARILGLLFLLMFGWITRLTLDEIRQTAWYKGSDVLMNLLWLLFVINPNMLIRFTRVSNEAMMCVLAALAVLLFTRLIIHGYNSKTLLLLTVCSAIAFLTKATSMLLVFLVFMVCAYYRKWKELFIQAGIYLVIVAPWFALNYHRYGALTGMKEHLDFVLPIVNPDMVMPDIRTGILNYFRSYFLNYECGSWFDIGYYNGFFSPFCILLIIASVAAGLQHLAACLHNKLQFTYESEERKKTLFLSFALMPVFNLAMHAIQSVMTLNNSLKENRYCFMINGLFCVMLLIALSPVSERNKKIISWIVAAVFAYNMVALVGAYTGIVMSNILFI